MDREEEELRRKLSKFSTNICILGFLLDQGFINSSQNSWQLEEIED